MPLPSLPAVERAPITRIGARFCLNPARFDVHAARSESLRAVQYATPQSYRRRLAVRADEPRQSQGPSGAVSMREAKARVTASDEFLTSISFRFFRRNLLSNKQKPFLKNEIAAKWSFHSSLGIIV